MPTENLLNRYSTSQGRLHKKNKSQLEWKGQKILSAVPGRQNHLSKINRLEKAKKMLKQLTDSGD